MPQKSFGASRVQAAFAVLLFLGATGLLLAIPRPSLAGDASQPAQDSNGSSAELPEAYEPAEPDPSLQEERQSIAKMRSRIKELEQKIATIRDNALDNNPELETKLKDLVVTENEVLKKNLDKENIDMQKLQKLHTSLESEDLEETEKQKLEKEFKQMYLGYRRAKMRTQRNETVQKLRQDFYSDLLEAFKAENPNAEQLIREKNRLEHQLKFAKEKVLPKDETAQ